MRQLLILFLFVLPLLCQDYDWKVGFNFRSTSAYVKDGPDEVYVLAETSSTERKTVNGNSATFNWDSSADLGKADRTTGSDVRLAGINYKNNNGVQRVFVVTLPQAGDYIIRLALGDTSAQGYQYLQVRDKGTPVFTIDDTNGTGAANYDDATGTNRTAAAWPGSNESVQHAFSTTTFQVVIGSPNAQVNSSTIAHLYLEYVPPAGGRRRIIPILGFIWRSPLWSK